MSEKYTPVSPEAMPVKMELLFPPQPLEMPARISVATLSERSLFIVPNVANASPYEMPEAYIAALEQSGLVEASQLEFSAIVTRTDLPKDISNLVTDIDTTAPWRLATAAELMVFGLVYPGLVNQSLLIALGETDSTHYPLALKRTGKRGLELQTDISGINREGKAILLVRITGQTDSQLPTIADDVTADSYKSIEAHAEKVLVFNQELAKFSAEAIQTMTNLSDMTELVGNESVVLRQLVGDTLFEKITDVVILARLKNTQRVDQNMIFTSVQLQTIKEIVASADCDEVVAFEIITQPLFLNSPMMQLRERAKVSHAVLGAILVDLEANTDISEADLETLSIDRKNFSKAIGYFNKLSLRH